MLHPTAFNTSEICFAYGVRHAVVSPGSRNAPLIISFARNNKIKKWIIPDERSAGFVALGIAQKEKQPVVLCCTSGTALLNYAPAIAEAFYREIPLIVLSADRPPALIDQRDGQTIRQFEALKNHVKHSSQLPLLSSKKNSDQYLRGLTSAIQISLGQPVGPVHVNVPFKEPFYPDKDQELVFDPIYPESIQSPDHSFNQEPDLEIFKNRKVLILVGQTTNDAGLNGTLKKLEDAVPILKSPLNNLDLDGINHVDLFLESQTQLKPDVLITSGLSVLSKKLKNFLRNNKPDVHYHFDPAGVEIDTYSTNPEIIHSPLSSFLEKMEFLETDQKFLFDWKKYSATAAQKLTAYLSTAQFSETLAFHKVLASIPVYSELHLGNSMPVRFAEMLGVRPGITSWCNRGTSGIDGCTSTAVGTSLVSNQLNVLLIGDVSFLYDRNAFFHNYSLSKLRIIVFNNYGGGIFRLIEGPREQPELDEYFETRHNRTAEYICAENNINYSKIRNLKELESGMSSFFELSDGASLMEIFTDPVINETVYNKLKQSIHE